jgi:MFS family permease
MGPNWNGSTHFNQFGDESIVKLIQHSDERSENDLGDDPSKLEWDLRVQEESIKAEKEKLDEIKVRIEKLEERIDEIRDESPSLADSIKSIFSWRNYSVYLATAWIYTSFSYMGLFFNLYVLEELLWEPLLLGSILSMTAIISATSRLIGGYVGDVTNRKHVSVAAMFMMAVYNLILGISVEFTWIFIALLFMSTMDVFKGGSTAYIMDNIPRAHGGLGISLFTAGRIFGIVTLSAFVILTQLLDFGPSLRLMFLTGGLFLLVSTAARAILLEGKAPEINREGVSLVRSFIQDNKRAANLLFKAVPGMIAIVIIDSLSDALFKFGAYIYIYNEVGIKVPGIILMTIVTILVSVPLILGTGRMTDRRGETKTSLIVYSIMPISALLLLVAPLVPYWVPMSLVNQAESLFPGLSAFFSTPFLAIVLKSVNDAVWYLLLLTIIQKNLPRRDTAKILSVFWFIVYIFASIGPTIGGVVFQYFYQGHLFILVLLLNLIILGWIASQGLVKEKVDTESTQ